MTIAKRKELVLLALAGIEDAEEHWRAVEQDPASTYNERRSAKNRFINRQDEFAWQWRNVKAILKAILNEPKDTI